MSHQLDNKIFSWFPVRKRTRIRLVIVLLGSPSKLTYRQNPEDNDTLIRELVIVFLHQSVDESANDGVACIVGVHLITSLINMVKIIVHEVIPKNNLQYSCNNMSQLCRSDRLIKPP